MIYLSLEQIQKIHEKIIDKSGGSHGIRDDDLLKSSLFRMQTTFDGQDLYPDIFTKAASLLHSIINNHAFVDGNKRTGFVSAITFLELNGYNTKFPKEKTEKFVISVASEKIELNTIANFLRQHCKKE
ncbi:MAG: type II toxin-antitoxin system death-on-curing family toxin [Patescibacteria group bacterium]